MNKKLYLQSIKFTLFIFLTVISVMSALPTSLSYAQEHQPSQAELDLDAIIQSEIEKQKEAELLKNQKTLDEASKITSTLVTENTKITGRSNVVRFVPATRENIVRLLWLFNVVDVTDLEAVDAYIRASECNLYEKYYNDEFEWRKIEMATVDYLQKYSGSFSNYVEIIQPVEIGRYDFDLNGFTLNDNGELFNMKTIQISDSKEMDKECNLSPEEDARFQGTAVVTLKNPINIDFIRVPHTLAKEYLQFFEDRYGTLDGTKNVYFKYRIRIDRYSRFDPGSTAGPANIFEGKILNIDIYADQEMFLLLYQQAYE